MNLPYDIARCSGNTSPICQHCRRREPGRDYWQTVIAPRATGNECPHYYPPTEIYKTAQLESENDT